MATPSTQPRVWDLHTPALHIVNCSVALTGSARGLGASRGVGSRPPPPPPAPLTPHAGARFGFRNFSSASGRFWLNGRPLFIRGNSINPPGRSLPSALSESKAFALDYIARMKNTSHVNALRIGDGASSSNYHWRVASFPLRAEPCTHVLTPRPQRHRDSRWAECGCFACAHLGTTLPTSWACSSTRGHTPASIAPAAAPSPPRGPCLKAVCRSAAAVAVAVAVARARREQSVDSARAAASPLYQTMAQHAQRKTAAPVPFFSSGGRGRHGHGGRRRTCMSVASGCRGEVPERAAQRGGPPMPRHPHPIQRERHLGPAWALHRARNSHHGAVLAWCLTAYDSCSRSLWRAPPRRTAGARLPLPARQKCPPAACLRPTMAGSAHFRRRLGGLGSLAS